MQELQHSHSSPQQLVQQAKKCSNSELSSNSLEKPSPRRAERIREGKLQKSPLRLISEFLSDQRTFECHSMGEDERTKQF